MALLGRLYMSQGCIDSVTFQPYDAHTRIHEAHMPCWAMLLI